jgi:hypothetical protein
MDPQSHSSLQDAVESMKAVKQEHREILNQVASDPGMAPGTRWALISHLYDEEDEHLAHIASLLSSQIQSPTSPATPGPSRLELTVGSLRPEPSEPNSSSGSVGSLRRR